MFAHSWLNGVRNWFSKGTQMRTPWRNTIRRRQRHVPRQISLESLEERILLSAIVVTGTGDSLNVDGFVTLREAITSFNNGANVNADVTTVGTYGVSDTINFTIVGAGVQTISPSSPLPTLLKPVAINGYSQSGTSANMLVTSDNAVLLIQLDGNDLVANGLVLGAGSGGSSVAGLVINRFTGSQLSGYKSNRVN